MVDKDFCMSSFLVFRYLIDDDKDFYENTRHQVYKLIPEDKRILVWNEKDIDSRHFVNVDGECGCERFG